MTLLGKQWLFLSVLEVFKSRQLVTLVTGTEQELHEKIKELSKSDDEAFHPRPLYTSSQRMQRRQ